MNRYTIFEPLMYKTIITHMHTQMNTHSHTNTERERDAHTHTPGVGHILAVLKILSCNQG